MSRRVPAAAGLLVLVIAAGTGPLATAHAKRPDLTGAWRLDPNRSQLPPRHDVSGSRHGHLMGHMGHGGGWGGGGMRPGGSGGDGGESAEVGDRRSGRGARGVAGRPMPLPDLMRVAQSDSLIEIADSTGMAIADIATGAALTDGDSSPFRIQRQPGEWKGSRLEVNRDLNGAVKITDTWELKDKGGTLEIATRVVPEDGPTLDFKRVYRRVAGP
jgi:hypothetical protein